MALRATPAMSSRRSHSEIRRVRRIGATTGKCVDPSYDSEALARFAPMLRRVCSEPRYRPDDHV
jgi:hypothetical protein